ncbi:MAG: hypothetical protein GF381_00350 [Candidatus Pacebacteria bacterium]|nr:hypothetical protein [Candidatus Paceibacterota bacterium]
MNSENNLLSLYNSWQLLTPRTDSVRSPNDASKNTSVKRLKQLEPILSSIKSKERTNLEGIVIIFDIDGTIKHLMQNLK